MAKITVLVILVYLAGVVFSLFQGAHWGFYLYQIVYFLNPENRWWSNTLPAFGYSFVAVIVLIFSFALRFKEYNNNKLMEAPVTKWMILLVAIYWVASFYAIDQEYHKQTAIEFLKLAVIIGFAFKILDTIKRLEWSLMAYIIGSAYIGYEAFVVGRNSNNRVEGIGLVDAPEANGTAAAIVATMPLIIYFLWQGSTKVKFAILLMGPLIVNGLVLINSRGSFLGAAVGIIVFMFPMFFSRFKIKNQKAVAIGLAFLGVAGLLVLVDATFIERMATLTNPEDEATSGSKRVNFWMATFDILRDYPLGVGASGYEILSSLYIPEEFMDKRFRAVHSIWFQTLSEIGWHGFTVFVLVIFSSFRALAKTKKLARSAGDHGMFYLAHALYSAFLGLLVTSTFINQFRTQIVYWLVLFIACLHSIALNEYSQKVKQDKKLDRPGLAGISARDSEHVEEPKR